MRAWGLVVEKKKETEMVLEPFQKEENWLAISITLAIIAVVIGGFGLLWIFEVGPIDEIDDRIKVATLVGTGFLALITYSTVIWRGLVSARQANEQKRANDAKDEENTAKLLLDGTRLLHSDSDIENMVGISVLEQVVNSRFSENARLAMNLFADFTFMNASNRLKASLLRLVSEAMHTGVKSGYRADRRVDFNLHQCIGLPSVIVGFTELGFTNGAFLNRHESYQDHGQKVTYGQCRIAGLTFRANESIGRECFIENCKLWHIKVENIQHNYFYQSDFSNTLITFASVSDRLLRNRSLLDDHIGSNALTKTLRYCFYYRDSPPKGDGADFILPYLEARARPAT